MDRAKADGEPVPDIDGADRGAQVDDFLLAELDFERCQGLVDLWRERPESERTKKPLAKKTCQNNGSRS